MFFYADVQNKFKENEDNEVSVQLYSGRTHFGLGLFCPKFCIHEDLYFKVHNTVR